ncbi:nucleotide exchange factor GrpE [Singulisphaera sp. PoT]|uniref:nucleotide exchange factor GrpE n=1 Tax=Singulisphaera sp. PoT TaxID=3411797 RepID=UPI003BF61209
MSDANPFSENPQSEGQAKSSPQNEDLTQVIRQRDEYLEQLLRSKAEFANYQKRSKTQADADRAYAVGSLVKDLLDGLDNLERATDALRASSVAGITEGLDMVQKQLLATLAKHGVEPISALGQPFDPNEHEALTQQQSAEYPEGTVVAELSKGYRIKDRVLRPTKVAVSIKPLPH